MAYSKHTWTNGSGEALNATNLNEMETGIDEAHSDLATHEIDTSTHGVTGTILGTEDKDVVNGIAGLNSSGNLLVKGDAILLTKDGSGFTRIYERTTNVNMVFFQDVGGDAFKMWLRGDIGLGAGVQSYEFLHAGYKDIANGIAGLDASSKQVPAQHFVSAPAAANSTGTAGQQAYDASYFYLCYDTDTWARFALSW